MKIENKQENDRAAHGENLCGHNGSPRADGELASVIEEKLEQVKKEIEEIEELVHGGPGKGHHDQGHHHEPKVYCIEIEGVEHPWSRETMTVAEIRLLGNLPPDQPVIEVNAENEERILSEGEVIHLKAGHRYGKKVRYKRGLQDRVAAELDWLRRFYPGAEWTPSGPNGWVKIPSYGFPAGIWNRQSDTICFEVPVGYPGQAPYGFYVSAGLRLQSSGAMPQAYEDNAATPFPGSWGKFSWTQDGTWKPTGDIASGSNLTNFVLTFADRLRESL